MQQNVKAYITIMTGTMSCSLFNTAVKHESKMNLYRRNEIRQLHRSHPVYYIGYIHELVARTNAKDTGEHSFFNQIKPFLQKHKSLYSLYKQKNQQTCCVSLNTDTKAPLQESTQNPMPKTNRWFKNDAIETRIKVGRSQFGGSA
jgi:hypothetical protein